MLGQKLVKRKFKWALGVLLSFLMLIVSFQNCSAVRSANEESKLSLSASEQEVLGKEAMGILSAKCLTCHNPDTAEGGIADITDLNYLLFYRLVIPAQPEISDIIRVIKEGTMPPRGGITTNELQILNKWILEGLTDSDGNVTLPGGSSPLEPTFASIKTRIFNTKCLGCHGATLQRDGISFETYESTIAVANVVNPGNPGTSRLVTSVERTGADYMPNGGGARLNEAEKAAIRGWIQAGALR